MTTNAAMIAHGRRMRELALTHEDTSTDPRDRAVGTEERAALAHLRGWCHDSTTCPTCRSTRSEYERGYNDAIRKVAEG